MAILYRTDGTHEGVKPASNFKFTLEEVQELVGGPVEQLASRDSRLLLVHEEGQRKNLAVNQRATDLLDPEYGGTEVCGNVLVVFPYEWC